MAEQELPLFLGLNDKIGHRHSEDGREAALHDQRRAQGRQSRQMGRAAAHADPDRRARRDRMPGQNSLHCRLCQAPGRSELPPGLRPGKQSWSLKAPFPHPCDVAGVSIGTKIYTFGGFVEQNRCPHSKCFVYDTAADQWASIAPISRPRGAMSAIVLDGKIHVLGGRDVRSVEWHEVYDPDDQQIFGPRRNARFDRHAAFRRPARPHGRRRGRR